MANIERLSEVSLKIITYAGTAKSNYILALKSIKNGDESDYKAKMDLGDENFRQAHSFHIETLKEEAESLDPQVSMLLMHAEDQLMSAETIKFVITEMKEMIDLIKTKEDK